ncbi:hypothetical protein D3C71_1696050 [compost metagenome]
MNPASRNTRISASDGNSTCSDDTLISSAKATRPRTSVARSSSLYASRRGPVTGVNGMADSSLG